MLKKLLIVALSIWMLMSVATFACNSHGIWYCPQKAQERVLWSIRPWLSLRIEHSFTDLGTFSCRDSADIIGANHLYIDGNVAWSLSAKVGGIPINGHCPNYFLSVTMTPSNGSAKTVLCDRKAEARVDYHLRHLNCLVPGNYTAVVVYTVTSP